MEFTLTINCDNDAFEPVNDEVARILRHLATRLETGHISGLLTDANGNTVGTFSFR